MKEREMETKGGGDAEGHVSGTSNRKIIWTGKHPGAQMGDAEREETDGRL